MIYYILIFVLLLIPLIIDKGKFSKRNNIIYYFILPLFLCFGYMTGSDWRGYELSYDNINSFKDVFLVRKEFGYALIGYLFKIIGLSFWHYSITIKLIGYYVFLSFYKKYSDGNVFGLIFFFAIFALFLWIDHPARNFCAVIVYLFSFKYILERRFFKYLFICLLASFFHLTAIVLIPIYFFYRYYSTKKLVLFIIISLFLLFIQQTLFGFINDYLMLFEIVNNRLGSYINSDTYMTMSTSFKGLAIHLFLMTIMLINRKKIEKEFKYGYFIIFLSILFFFFLVIGLAFPIFFRFKLFFAIPYSIILSYMFVSLSKINRLIIIVMFISIPFLILIQNITSSHKYIPYSNYVEYIFNEKPSYYYRDNYNYTNSPYRNQINQ